MTLYYNKGLLRNNLYTIDNGMLYPFMQLDINDYQTFGINLGADRNTKGSKGLWIPYVENENSTVKCVLNKYCWTYIDPENKIQQNLHMIRQAHFGYFINDIPNFEIIPQNQNVPDRQIDDPGIESFSLCSLEYLKTQQLATEAPSYLPDITYEDLVYLKIYITDIEQTFSFTKKGVAVLASISRNTDFNINIHNIITNRKATELLVAMAADTAIEFYTDDNTTLYNNNFNIEEYKIYKQRVSVDSNLKVTLTQIS